MATVSILIPAKRPDYLGRALASAQQQTFDDLEILVGDETSNGQLRSIVEAVGDQRVRYVEQRGSRGLSATENLYRQAGGRYVKWLPGDDMLMPEAVQLLVDALRDGPDSALAFAAPVFVDANDAVVHTPPLLAKAGERTLVDHDLLVREMVGRLNNFIGLRSNVLIDRERANGTDLFAYRSIKLGHLGDVAMYLNLAQRAPLVLLGGYWSMQRCQPEAISLTTSPHGASAGLYEWELFVRGEAAVGRLIGPALDEAAQRLAQLYLDCVGELPEMGRLLANIGELKARSPQELFESPSFQADFAHARVSMMQRASNDAAVGTPAQRQQAAAIPLQATVVGEHCARQMFVAEAGQSTFPANASANAAPIQPHVTPKTCAVCEQQVDAWVPYRHGSDHPFIEDMEPAGSTLSCQLCPKCASTDRERHLWLYIALSGVLEGASSMRILHIAPEASIESRIRRLAPLEYSAGSLFPHASGHRPIDVQSLEFASDYFDLVICNNVLERVEDPVRALAELNRVLKPKGRLIAQTPYSPVLKRTLELTVPPSAQFAARYFAQPDHQRLFGADIVNYFREAGLSGDMYSHAAVLSELDADSWGVDSREPFFLSVKETAPASAVATERVLTVREARAVESPPKPIRIVCATRCSKEKFLNETALGRSLATQRYVHPPELLLFDDNTTGLSTLYNAAIDQAAANPAVLVFMHDDVAIHDFFLIERIHDALRQFDVVGLAGNRRRLPQQPAWAFATPQFVSDAPEYLSGTVGHGKGGVPTDGVSFFGPSGVECKLLDGLMLIADSERLIRSDVRFDEQFDFHFYDMDFCRQAELKGLRMGTWPISVVHESGGAFNSPRWRAGYTRYLQKYGD